MSSTTDWRPEYDNVLRNIALTDTVETEWPTLRDIIKSKLSQNIELFLAETKPPPPPVHSPPLTLSNGGLKLPPFPPKQQSGMDVPVSYMTKEQADVMKGYIDAELDAMDSRPPFTIQRVCELSVDPTLHYKSVGKYLRAVEKSLLVTSSIDSFPASVTSQSSNDPLTLQSIRLPGSVTASPTPLFSPIPFLHEDARRSKSQSPPPSPLVLPGSVGSVTDNLINPLEPKGLGMVDELDDPSPGHMSDHPTALTSVTALGTGPNIGNRGIIDTLEQRFIKAESEDAMQVDPKKEDQPSQ